MVYDTRGYYHYAAGFSAAIQGGLPLLRTGWIFWSIVLFTLSGVIFALKLVPLQRKILQITENKPAEKFNDEIYQPSFAAMGSLGVVGIAYSFCRNGHDGIKNTCSVYLFIKPF